MASATGNYWKDTKDLIAHRQGANLPRRYKIMLSVGGWLVNKGIAAYIAYKWFYAMTDPMTTWQDKVVISAGLIGALISFKIGAMIGGFIGTFAIATPLVGTIAGGLLGGYLAAKHGQFIAMYIARMLLGMPQPPEVVEDLTQFKAEQKAKIDSVIGKNGGFKMMDSLNAGRAAMLAAPVPLGARPTGQGGLATGGAGEDAASVGSGFNARVPPGQISGIGFAGFGSKQPGENNTNISKGLTGSHFNALGGGISSARKKALAAANIKMMMASGNFGNAINGGTFNTESNNVKLKTVLSNLTATSNALLPHEIKALQAQSNGGGTIIANNDNDNSTTHHHQYGSNGMRTVDTLMAMNGHGGYGVMGLQAATAMGGFSSP
jgi:hypothetical protein